MNTQALVNFIQSVLDDEHGISETAFKHLRDFQDSIGSATLVVFDPPRPELSKRTQQLRKAIDEMMNQVDATDGRFYLPEKI